MARHWLKTRPGIVSRTADGAYGKYLKTRIPTHWLTKTPGQGVTVPQGGVGPTSAPGIQDVYAHPELYGIPLAPGYKPTTPADWLPTKRHIPGLFGDGSLRDWQGQDWLARMQQLLDNLPAPFKNWLSNYPRLPQSTIPTPKDKYSVPGRPPIPETPYNNPFAWRRKNNGWW